MKRGICGFRLSESSRSRPRAPSRKLDPTRLFLFQRTPGAIPTTCVINVSPSVDGTPALVPQCPRFVFLGQAHPANDDDRRPQVSPSSLRSNWMSTEFQRIVLLSRAQLSQPCPRPLHDHFVCASPIVWTPSVRSFLELVLPAAQPQVQESRHAKPDRTPSRQVPSTSTRIPTDGVPLMSIIVSTVSHPPHDHFAYTSLMQTQLQFHQRGSNRLDWEYTHYACHHGRPLRNAHPLLSTTYLSVPLRNAKRLPGDRDLSGSTPTRSDARIQVSTLARGQYFQAAPHNVRTALEGSPRPPHITQIVLPPVVGNRESLKGSTRKDDEYLNASLIFSESLQSFCSYR